MLEPDHWLKKRFRINFLTCKHKIQNKSQFQQRLIVLQKKAQRHLITCFLPRVLNVSHTLSSSSSVSIQAPLSVFFISAFCQNHTKHQNANSQNARIQYYQARKYIKPCTTPARTHERADV